MIDSSSLIAVREQVGRSNERIVFDALSALAAGGQLIWPPEVADEVNEGVAHDPAVLWLRSQRSHGEASANLDTVKFVLEQAPTLVDSDSTREQADPYVVALARDVIDRDLFSPNVTILTEDRRDKPGKVSLATAAGLLRIPTIPLSAFLTSRRIMLP